MSKFDFQQFFRRPDAVAVLVRAADVFGFLKRSFELPTQWLALVTRTVGDRQLIPAGGAVLSDEAEDILFARNTPVELSIDDEGAPTRDQFQFTANVRMRLALVADGGELTSFHRNVMGSFRVATSANLVRYLQATVQEVIHRFITETEADALTNGSALKDAQDRLTQALEPMCFTAGLTIASPVAIRFHSATFNQVRQSRDEAAKHRSEHEAARKLQETVRQAQAEHVEHLSSLLSRLTELSTKSPETPLHDLIRTFGERERGRLYEALFSGEAPASKTRWLVVAVGEELLYFDPRNPSAPQRRFIIGGPAGAVRSVQSGSDTSGKQVLLLGAATGVYRLPLDRVEPDATYVVAGAPTVRGGFNAVVQVEDRILACHSELGIQEWSASSPGPPRPQFASMMKSAKTVRGLSIFKDKAYCAVDDRIIAWTATESVDVPTHVFTGSRSAITSLCPSSNGLFAGNSDGDVLHWAAGRDTNPEMIHTGHRRAAESVWFTTVSGVPRLFYTDTSFHIHAHVPGDTFVCRYEAGGQTLRRVDVAEDLLVATNELRDRLICWLPSNPQRPSATIPVAAICGRTVQDVCLVADA